MCFSCFGLATYIDCSLAFTALFTSYVRAWQAQYITDFGFSIGEHNMASRQRGVCVEHLNRCKTSK